MFTALYFIFIFPLENILALLLGGIFFLIPNEAAGIVLLSLFVHLFLIKIFALTDNRAQFENARKKRFDSQIKAWKTVYSKAKVFAFTQTLYRQNHYHPIFALCALGGLIIQIPFFYAMYLVVTTHGWQFLGDTTLAEIPYLTELDSSLGFHALPVVMTSITLFNVFLASLDKTERIQGTIIALLFLILLYDMPPLLVLYWTANMIFALLRTLLFNNKKYAQPTKKENNFYFAPWCVVNIAFLICIFSPINLYVSDISQFSQNITTQTLCALFGSFLLASFIGIYLLHFVPLKLQKLSAYILAIILFSGVLNSFIFTGDYGEMDRFVFRTLNDPTANTNKTFLNILMVLFSTAFVYFFFKKLKTIFKILFITLLIVSLYHTAMIFAARLESQQNLKYYENASQNRAPYEKEMFSYSKNDKNIVVIILDMFTGSHFPYLLEYFPQIKTALDGFTHFDNATSSANATPVTVPSIIGGEYYTIYNQNQRNEDHNRAALNAYFNIGDAFGSAGFESSFIIGDKIYNTKKLKNHPNIFWLDEFEKLNQYFLQTQNTPLFNSAHVNFDIVRFLSFGLFKFAFEGKLRHSIYNNGEWLAIKRDIDQNSVIAQAAPLYAFANIQNTQSQKPTFKFVHSLMTHFPYGISAEGGQCHYLKKSTVLKNANVFAPPNNLPQAYTKARDPLNKEFSEQHFDSEACALFLISSFLNNLKTLGIYDNTQIFIVSDHAGPDSITQMPRLAQPFLGQDTLFLFKDFNQRGDLKSDNRLMVNYDIATIFCDNLKNGCKNVQPNILKNYPKNREIINFRVPSTAFDYHPNNRWIIHQAYKIKGNIYEKNSYEELPQSFFEKK